MKVVVAGAGIGGLCAKIALDQLGFEVRIVERVPLIEPVGAGLLLQPNAMRSLAELGLDSQVEDVGASIRRGRMQSYRGKVLSEVDLQFGGKRRPAVGIHRAALQELLLSSVNHAVEFGVEVLSATQDHFQAGRGMQLQADVLVGADGIHSRVAETLGCPDLRYAGYTCWRGVTESGVAEKLRVSEDAITEVWGPGARVGIVPIGGGRLYWFATRNGPAGGRDDPATLRDDLMTLFESFPSDVLRVIGATPSSTILRSDVVDRPPRRAWGRGRVTLLGDAAHPMTPNLGQGAGQAIEDAVALKRHLRGAAVSQVPQRLRAYEVERIARTTRIVNASFQMGRIGQLENRFARFLRDLMVSRTPASVTEKQVIALTG